MHITTTDGEAVAESPYPVRVLAGRPEPRRTVVEGQGRRCGVAGRAADALTVAARDAFGNAVGGSLADVLPLEVPPAALPRQR